MTYQEKLAFIRAKCIEANWEIDDFKFGCEFLKNGLLYVLVTKSTVSRLDTTVLTLYCYVKREFVTVVGSKIDRYKNIGRPIRLADALLAISEKCGGMLSLECVDQHGAKENHLSRVVGRLLKLWNLHKDDLNEQDEATINFIHSIIL